MESMVDEDQRVNEANANFADPKRNYFQDF
jgi:hypothetical protein